MPIGGKLVLKGGVPLKGVEKKKKKKKPDGEALQGVELLSETEPGPEDNPAVAIPPVASATASKTYEEEFEFEKKRMVEPKTRNTPWGSTYRAPPEILHGYTSKVTGKTAEERLDLRAASKADKFCK